jgi:uncharacterized RDD family membrane protein YckC
MAGLARRLGALLYETLLVVALVLVLGFAMLPLVSPGAAAKGAALVIPPLHARVALFCVIFAVLAGYFTWSWSDGRSTLAQKTWRVRVISLTGEPPIPRRALARYLAAWIGPAMAVLLYVPFERHGRGPDAGWLVALNFAWALFDRDRQFLHDRLAGTGLALVGRRTRSIAR